MLDVGKMSTRVQLIGTRITEGGGLVNEPEAFCSLEECSLPAGNRSIPVAVNP